MLAKKTKAIAVPQNDGLAVTSRNLLLAVADRFGGTEGLAARIASEYDAAPPGSIHRRHLLRLITQLAMHCSQQDQPDEEQSDEELRKELTRCLRLLSEEDDDHATGGADESA